jgi:hypothetical protein
MVGPYLGTGPRRSRAERPRGRGLSGDLGLRRGLGRSAGFPEGVTVYAAARRASLLGP